MANREKYAVQPDLGITDRLDERAYARASKVSAKWESVEPKDFPKNYCGNIEPLWTRKTLKASIGDMRDKFSAVYEKNTHYNDYKVISSALALYRLLSLFRCHVLSLGPEGYKVTWEVCLRHKETGEVLIFGEWKGGFNIFTRFHSPKELPNSYKSDAEELLTLLVSKKCPHPYDGVVSGSVA